MKNTNCAPASATAGSLARHRGGRVGALAALTGMLASGLGLYACSESSSASPGTPAIGGAAANTPERGGNTSASEAESGGSSTKRTGAGGSVSTGGSVSRSSSNNTSGSAPSESKGGTGGSSSSDTIGRFSITLNEAVEELATQANTTVSGKVYDGVNPEPYIPSARASDTNCTVYAVSVPFCEGGCADGVCVGEDTCKPYPSGKNVGEVTVTGVATADGKDSFALMMSNNNYRTGGGLSLGYPGFNPGDAIRLSASGGDYPAFDITAKGIAPLSVTAESLVLSKTSPLKLTWEAADADVGSKIFVNVNLSHHGGSKGYIECNVADSGSLTIPAEFIAQLIELGVAGFPTLSVIRSTEGSAQVDAGRIALVVSSPFVRTVNVEGFVSCQEDTACQPPQTCNKTTKLCE
ncbi:MAG TPA: hypothetical protein VKP30_01325 [Polyangiaceae bacterium]|nr:hypothetical protein [Polyangiaceae bacterium]